MRNNRVVTIAVILGVVIIGVTFLGAARMSGDDGKTSKDAQKLGTPSSISKGLVVFGLGDVDNGVGLIPLYPETFPQPCKVKKVFVTEGQTVIKNQKLVEFDSKLADLTVEEARAGLAQAEAAQRRAEAMVHMAEQTLDAHRVAIDATEKTLQGKALELKAAELDLDEQKRKLGVLTGNKNNNDPEIRIAEKKVEAAQKVYESEKVKLDGLKAIAPVSKKEEAVAAVAEAKAAIAKQKAVLDKALYGQELMTLEAPDDGKIVRSLVAEGLTFGAQTRQPAILFQSKGDIVVRAEVDQEFASRVALGQEAVINDDGDPSLKWRGKVKRIADSFLPKRASSSAPDGLLLNDTRVLECVISIQMQPNSPVLRVGQRVKVSIGME